MGTQSERVAAALAVLDQFRAALRTGSADQVATLLDPRPRAPAESDLFSQLRAAVGLSAAVARLQRFWTAASAERYAVRVVHADEIEVYERITTPTVAEPLRSVTLLRRGAVSVRPGEVSAPSGATASWRVVTTCDAPDDRPRMFVYTTDAGPTIDDVAFSRRCVDQEGPFAELILDGTEGILVHPLEDWVGSLRGPMRHQAALTLPNLPDGFYELAVEQDNDPIIRARQLGWLSDVTLAAADTTGSTHLGVPGAERIIPRETLRHLLVRPPAGDGARSSDPLPIHRLATIWVKLHRLPTLAGEGYLGTRGLLHFGLPELEVCVADFSNQDVLADTVLAVVSVLVDRRLAAEVGVIFRLQGVSLTLEPGRRGFQEGHSYGPFGALRLVPAAGA